MPILSIRIVLNWFYLFISHFENFLTWISRLPFAFISLLLYQKNVPYKRRESHGSPKLRLVGRG